MKFEINDLHELSEAFSFLATAVGAGYLLNAFYQALILKKLSGETITPEIEDRVRSEVIQMHDKILKMTREGEQVYRMSGKFGPS